MNKTILFFLILLISNFVLSCSPKSENKIVKTNNNPTELYILAKQNLDAKKLIEATKQFDEIIYFFPLSNEAIQSQIMLGFIDYINMDYDEAIYKFNMLIKTYPSHKNIDYVYYMIAICFYEQINHESLDGTKNLEALKKFQQLNNRFPNSEYIQDSNQKIMIIKENIAAKHMNIGLYYLSDNKYMAAMNRFNIVINEHSKSKFTPEALYRLVEIYYKLGLVEDSKKTTAVIAYNYPKSIWYKNAYDLINKDNKKENFMNKIFNIFKNEKKD